MNLKNSSFAELCWCKTTHRHVFKIANKHRTFNLTGKKWGNGCYFSPSKVIKKSLKNQYLEKV